MKRFFSNLNFTVGFILSAVVVFAAVLSLVWTPFDANKMNARERLQGPSWTHPLGTDQYGRDTLSRVMTGAVNSIIVGLVTVAIGLSIGVLLGLAAAYFGKFVDEVIMRFSDLLFGFPAVLTAILITSILGPSMINAMLAIGIFYIPVFARLTRAVALSVWEREFITAARVSGIGDWAIAWRHVLPNTLSTLVIQATIQFAVAILAEAGLSYLGLGTQPPHASWGRMLSLVPAQLASSKLIKPTAVIGVNGCRMGEFPAVGVEINREFAVHMNGDGGTGRDEDRIKALGLAFQEPLAHLVAAAGDGFTEHIAAGIAGDGVGGHTRLADHRRGFSGRGRFGRGLHGRDPDTLGQKGRCVGFTFAGNTWDALRVRDPAQGFIGAPDLAVAIIAGKRSDRAIIKHKGHRFESPGDTGQRPVTNRRAAPHHALHAGDHQAIRGQVIRPGDHLERHGIPHLPLPGDTTHQGRHRRRTDERGIAGNSVDRLSDVQ